MGTSSVKVSLLDIESGRLRGLVDQPHNGDAHRDPARRMGGAGPRNVVAVHRRRDPRYRLAPPYERGPRHRHHLPDARAGLSRPRRGAGPAQVDHLVRFAGRGNRRRGAGRARPRPFLQRLLNSPGNFTASKPAWVKRNEPELFARIDRFMLPGDYIAYRLSGGPRPPKADSRNRYSGTSPQGARPTSWPTTTASPAR